MLRSLQLAALVSAVAAGANLRDLRSLFVIEDDSFGAGSDLVRLKVLRNRATGEKAEIAYSAGGRTEEVVLKSPRNGALRSVLLSSNRNASDVKANVGWKGDMLLPYANRIKNGTYKLNGKTYYMERNEDRGSYGKIGLHGYLYKKSLRVQSMQADNDAAALVLAYDFDGSDPGYPFPLSVVLTYCLDKHGLSITTRAINNAVNGEPLPFFNSWHSYFKVADISLATIELDQCSGWNHISVTGNSNVKSDLIPTGLTTPFHGFDGKSAVGGTFEEPTYYDDEFKATASDTRCTHLSTKVHDPSTGDTSVLWGDSQFRWIQIFSGTKKVFREQAIAVEAMSGEADAWNNMQGMRLVQAGEQWQGTFGIYLDDESESSVSSRRIEV